MQNSINNVSYPKKSADEVIDDLVTRGFETVRGKRFVSFYLEPKKIEGVVFRNEFITFYKKDSEPIRLYDTDIVAIGDLEEIDLNDRLITVTIRRR